MIRFLFEGRPCYANIYVYDTAPREYHVHTVNAIMNENLPESMVLIERNEKLCLLEPPDIRKELLEKVISTIEEHLDRKK